MDEDEDVYRWVDMYMGISCLSRENPIRVSRPVVIFIEETNKAYVVKKMEDGPIFVDGRVAYVCVTGEGIDMGEHPDYFGAEGIDDAEKWVSDLVDEYPAGKMDLDDLL